MRFIDRLKLYRNRRLFSKVHGFKIISMCHDHRAMIDRHLLELDREGILALDHKALWLGIWNMPKLARTARLRSSQGYWTMDQQVQLKSILSSYCAYGYRSYTTVQDRVNYLSVILYSKHLKNRKLITSKHRPMVNFVMHGYHDYQKGTEPSISYNSMVRIKNGFDRIYQYNIAPATVINFEWH